MQLLNIKEIASYVSFHNQKKTKIVVKYKVEKLLYVQGTQIILISI